MSIGEERTNKRKISVRYVLLNKCIYLKVIFVVVRNLWEYFSGIVDA